MRAPCSFDYRDTNVGPHGAVNDPSMQASGLIIVRHIQESDGEDDDLGLDGGERGRPAGGDPGLPSCPLSDRGQGRRLRW